MDNERILNLTEYWRNRIIDSIERYSDCITFSAMSEEEFIEECINTMTYYFDNEMLGESINYNDIVSDTAKAYEIWTA